MRKKILIFGHYGVPNWGDEAILSGILSQINISEYAVTVVSHSPQQTQKLHGVRAVLPLPFGIRSFFRFGWGKTLRSIREADYIIFGGGGLFQPSPPKALRIWDWYLRICLLFQKRMFFVGQSFGDISNAKVSSQMKKRMQKVSFFSVRDASSALVLEKQWGVHSSKIHYSTDAVFFHRDRSGRKEGASIVLMALREGDLSVEQEQALLLGIKQKFPSHAIQVLVMQSFQSGDEQFAYRNDLDICSPQSVDEVFKEIEKADCIISSRLHGGIIATVCETPFLAVACREKIARFFGEGFSLSPQVLYQKNAAQKVVEKIGGIVDNPELISAFKKEQQDKLDVFFPQVLV